MSISNAINDLIENATQYDAGDFSIEIDPDSIELGAFEWYGSGSPDFTIEADYARLNSIELGGDDIGDYRIVPASVIDAIAELDLSEIEASEIDPADYVPTESVRAVISQLIMLELADPNNDGDTPDFVTVNRAIDRMQRHATEAAAAALSDAIADEATAESIEVETDSE